MKRLVDIIIASIALLLLSPIFLLVAYKVRKNLGSPIFFYQERPGKDCKHFRMMKFRSMKNAVDENGIPLPDDQRITPFGKKLRSTSLDEMPQLINVLKGDMSLVGTRPPTLDEWNKYELRHRARLAFKPGITGLWQVSGRSNITDFEEIARLDKEYIKNWRFSHDIQILLKTVQVVFKKEGSM